MAGAQTWNETETKQLLALFPVSVLREEFGSGSKEEICEREAKKKTDDDVAKIKSFVGRYFGCCKQHVYVFENDCSALLPQLVSDQAPVYQGQGTACFVLPVEFTITTLEPLQRHDISLLWPIKIDIFNSYFTVRFVVLERNLSLQFGEGARVAKREFEEVDVIAQLTGTGRVADLNAGIKELWKSDFHDCINGRFKKAHSTTTEAMDERKGIKQHLPKIYGEMLLAPIQLSLFRTNGQPIGLDQFSANPSMGILGFPRYSPPGASDAVIQRILESN